MADKTELFLQAGENASLCIRPPDAPVDLTYTLKGSKSFANRALVLAAVRAFLAGERNQMSAVTTLKNVSPSKDSEYLTAALVQIGVPLTVAGTEVCVAAATVEATSEGSCEPRVINVGHAGTTSRFLTALFAGLPGVSVRLQGSDRLHERPIAPLVDALRAIGANISYEGREGCLPLTIHGTRLTGGEVGIDGSVSSQYLTALLLTGWLHDSPLSLRVEGELVSRSYVEMTLATLSEFNFHTVTNEVEGGLTISMLSPGQESLAKDYLYEVEGDGTGATYLWNLAMINEGRVRTYNISQHSIQGDVQYLKALERMGATIESGRDELGNYVEVRGPKEMLPVPSVDFEQLPDAAQSFAVLSSTLVAETTLTGLSTLRVKETDRISAITKELAKAGIEVREVGDEQLTVIGGTPKPARISTYHDHRMAMAFSLLAWLAGSVEIEDPAVVQKSFPEYWSVLEQAGCSLSLV